MATQGSWFRSREYFSPTWSSNHNNKVSDWISLEKGKKYYIEGRHNERTAADHFTVGLEIEKTNTTGHHHTMKEIQEITLNGTLRFDKTEINITERDGGLFAVSILNPKDSQPFIIGNISTNASDSHL